MAIRSSASRIDRHAMNIENSTILVTGGAGLIGSTIIDHLLPLNPKRIIVLDNLSRGTTHNLTAAFASGKVQLIEADIRNLNAIQPLFHGVDSVFHQAAIRITQCAKEPRECVEVLVDGTFNILEACIRNGVKRVVAASSASIYGMADDFPTRESQHPYNNRTLYGVAKVANEGFLRSFYDMYGLSYVALRYFNVYGPRMDIFGKYTEVLIRWLDCLDRGEPPKIFGDGTQTMDFIYSGDIAKANVLAMQSDVTDEVFNIASGTETSLSELLQALLRVTGHDQVTPVHLPERTVNPVARRIADVSKARNILGFSAETTLEQGLRKLVEWRQDALRTGTMCEYVTD
jgi:UDP-glucose 4-epimerase